MSSHRLRWIIALMSTALIGLVYFQWYWVDTVIRANEDGFRKDVLSALDNVVRKLEMQEALYVVNQRFSRPTVRQIQPPGYSVDRQSGSETIVYEFNGGFDSAGFNFFFSMDASGQMEVYSSSGQSVADRSNLTTEGNRVRSKSIPGREEIQSTISKVNNKSEMVVTVLEELMYPRRVINRFHPSQLDSLIKYELKEKGIDLGYSYGVINHNEARFVAISDAQRQQELVTSEYQATLFPNDVVGDPSILSIHFPGKSKFLMSKMWLTISSSGFLMLIILFCFGYAVHTIVKQKNISEMKNDFINNMTHELKTPIATIGLAAEALQDKAVVQMDSMRKRYMGVIQDENDRLASQVEKVLQMALIDRQELKFSFEKVNLHEIIEKAISKISVQVEQKRGKIQTSLLAEKTEINTDSGHLLNIIINLIDNAIKYSEDEPNIMIRTQNVKGNIILSVKDHGIGMTREEVKHIFQKFYRVPTGDLHDVKGFGLGLAYVKSVVDNMNGSVEVDSEPGKGSNFILKLPLYHG